MAKESGFGVGDLLKWGLLAGAAYYVYETFFATPAAAAPGTVSTTSGPVNLSDLVAAIQKQLGTSATPPVTSTTTPPAPATAALTTDSQSTQQSKLLAAAGVPATQLYTVSQWNYEFNQVYGHDPGTLGDDGSPMLIGAYLNLIHSKGLGAVRISVPMLLRVDGRRPVLAWASQSMAGDGTQTPNAMMDRPRGNYRRAG
jgi:hypothetical protein